MRILYAIQATGNGHLSRAQDVIPALMKRAEVDVMISGVQADIDLSFPIKYRYHGLSFIFGKGGGVDLLKTFRQNNTRKFIKEIKSCPVQDYDLVVNDFEPISAWACKLKGVRCISLSHQAALRSKKVPKPKHSDWMGSFILKNYAPCKEYFSFHFAKYDDNIYTPIIRSEIRAKEIHDRGHYTVYLPAYGDKRLIKVLSKIENAQWHVFSKHTRESYQIKNLHIQPVNSALFSESIAASSGVLCGAGFETPAEALFLHKKLMVIPMKSQYEQHFNAAGLKDLGVPVIKKLSKKHIKEIQRWVDNGEAIEVSFPNETQLIVDRMLEQAFSSSVENSKSVRFSIPFLSTFSR